MAVPGSDERASVRRLDARPPTWCQFGPETTCVFAGQHGARSRVLWEQEVVGSNPTAPTDAHLRTSQPYSDGRHRSVAHGSSGLPLRRVEGFLRLGRPNAGPGPGPTSATRGLGYLPCCRPVHGAGVQHRGDPVPERSESPCLSAGDRGASTEESGAQADQPLLGADLPQPLHKIREESASRRPTSVPSPVAFLGAKVVDRRGD